MKVLILKGLPASGKSTYAKELVAKGGWKRINKDDLRAMLDNGKWSRENEKQVVEVRDDLVQQFMLKGYNIVVDDTNLHPKHEAHLKEMVTAYADAWCDKKYTVEVKFFDVPVSECIKRDLNRPVSVGEKVIMGMYKQFLLPPVKPYEPVPGTPKAIMVDIDGTLAHMNGRSPYDPTLYHTDSLDSVVANIVDQQKAIGVKIIICSGRNDTYYDVTAKWLKDNGVPFDELWMRPMAYEPDDGHMLKDWVVKQRLFDEHIRERFDVKFVLDDRNQVVEMWRRNGLKCFQVESGDF